jgi:hypothetical protein
MRTIICRILESSREHLIEGEAEGRFAISVLLIMVVGDLAWRFLA